MLDKTHRCGEKRGKNILVVLYDKLKGTFCLFYSFFFHTFRCFYEAMRFQAVIQHDPFYSFYSFYRAKRFFYFFFSTLYMAIRVKNNPCKKFVPNSWQFVLKNKKKKTAQALIKSIKRIKRFYRQMV